MQITIEQILKQGIAAFREDKIEDAEHLFRTILSEQPLSPYANHHLGVLAIAVNNVDAALLYFKTALEANATIGQFWLSYIDALIKKKAV